MPSRLSRKEMRLKAPTSLSFLSLGQVPMGKGSVFASTLTKPVSLTQFSIWGLQSQHENKQESNNGGFYPGSGSMPNFRRPSAILSAHCPITVSLLYSPPVVV